MAWTDSWKGEGLGGWLKNEGEFRLHQPHKSQAWQHMPVMPSTGGMETGRSLRLTG